MQPNTKSHGFTLIELSIVLVIIGLIVGGILVGTDLITAARIRAQIAQIEKYNTAVNTFRIKYNALPGDMSAANAAAFGFFTRTGTVGDGDGDWNIAGLVKGGVPSTIMETLGGETVLFWTDLSAAGLIEGGFNDNSDALANPITEDQWAAEMPRAKIGNGNFIYVNGGYVDPSFNIRKANGFQIIRPAPNTFGWAGYVEINPGMTALESFNIDQKIDDGLPNSGKVLSMNPDKTMVPSFTGIPNWTNTPSLCVNIVIGFPSTSTYNIGTSGVSNVANCSLRIDGGW